MVICENELINLFIHFIIIILSFFSLQPHGTQRVYLPKKDDQSGRDKVFFNNLQPMVKLPFVMYIC